ncbi:MAG TPA: PilZ domain-containing protein [Hyphomicrobiaceae bacterium]|nr:PilZ domain-containing protein [Hyphomicrobiaceae bacterium]
MQSLHSMSSDAARQEPVGRAATSTSQGGWRDVSSSLRSASGELSEFALGRLIHDGAFSVRPEVAQSRAMALILTLRGQVRHTLVLTAICASAANVLHNESDPRAARALIHFYPVGSGLYILSATRYHRLQPDTGIAKSLDGFNAALDAAMATTMAFSAARQATPNLADVPTVDLCAAWRFACLQGQRLLTELDELIAIFHPIHPTDGGDELIKALEESAVGGTPLRAPDGEFAMPSWAEGRQLPRVAVACNASLLVGTKVHAIRITNISAGGLGIETPALLREDEIITIVVEGMVLPGRVVWSRAGRAGIALEQSLLDDSPEYRFLTSQSEFD